MGHEREQKMSPRKSRTVIAVADDDLTIRSNLATLLRSEGYDVREAADGLEATRLMRDPSISLLLLDLNMPGRNGMELLRDNADQLDEIPVIVITAYRGSGAAIEAMKLGAYDYITKPFDLDEVLFTVRRALTQQSLTAQVRLMSEEVAPGELNLTEEELIGQTPAMLNVFKMIGRVAATRESVLILGESGTGKELVASAIHRSSSRSDGPFIKVNVAALSSNLLESELFGHERGAFTGAVGQRIGRFEQADGGTLFLDEIGDMDVELQAKLLRVLQLGQFERAGGNATLQTDVRIISATNRNIPARVADGSFREDLLYRLNVVTIELPPLRERKDDIPLIADQIVRCVAQKYGWPQLSLSLDAVTQLQTMPWPGNVRQLQNTVVRAAILSSGRIIRAEDVQANPAGSEVQVPPIPTGSLILRDILMETERRVIVQALEREAWNRTKAAQVLGISRRQLFDKMLQYGLSK
jgi:DNA-binding NtrC family response regulator